MNNRPVPMSRDPWWGVVLVALVLLALIGGIITIWRGANSERQPAVVRYWPLQPGTSQAYRVTLPNGSSAIYAENADRKHGSAATDMLDAETQQRIAARALGVKPGDITTTLFEGFLENQLADVAVARIIGTRYDQNGTITTTTVLTLVEPQQVLALSIDGLPFDPPAPLFDTRLVPGATAEVTGTFGSSQPVPYTATLQLEATEAINTPLGRLEDCRRLLVNIRINTSDNRARSWFCAGVGVARQETFSAGQPEPERLELIAANTPGLTAALPLPPQLATSQARPVNQVRVFANNPPGTFAPIWSYRENGPTNHITAPPLVVEEPGGVGLLVYGMQNGRLLALDRASHLPRWRFQTGGAIYGMPTVANGVVFAGSADRRLYAIDLASGTFRWAFASRDAIAGSPAVAGDSVYIGSEDRVLYALDAATGTERWRFQAGDAIASSPAVADGVVYIGADDGALYALDAATGTLRWAFLADDAITAAPIVRDGVVYAASYDGHVYALNAATTRRDGELVWSYEAGYPIVADLVLSTDTIYTVTTDSKLHAISRQDGTQRWRYASERSTYGSPLLLGDQLLINRANSILSVDAATGTQRSVTELSEDPSYHSLSSDGRELFVGQRNGYLQVLGDGGNLPWVAQPLWVNRTLADELFRSSDLLNVAPVRDGDRLIYLSAAGQVFAVALADGRQTLLGKLENLSSLQLLPPVVADGIFYSGDQYGGFRAFDLRAGRELWRVDLGGRSFSAPVVVDGRLLVATTGSASANAYALDAKTGRELWRKSFDTALAFGSSALLYQNRYYLAANQLIALDPLTGATLWQSDGAVRPFYLAQLGQAIYGYGFDADFNGQLIAWDAASGAQLQATALDLGSLPRLQGGFVAAGQQLLLTLNDRSLVVLNADGSQRWRSRENYDLHGPPVVAGERVLLLDRQNHLLARALDDGRLLGDFTFSYTSSYTDFSSMVPLVHEGSVYTAFYQTVFALKLR